MAVFADRAEAGRKLAERLLDYRGREGLLVLALPRGGVVVGFAVAEMLKASLDVFIVRKIGFPGQPELAIGAVAETGVRVVNDFLLSHYGIPQSYIEQQNEVLKKEIAKRIELYRNGKNLPPLKGRTVILVDDGVATGSTMKAAIETLRKAELERLVVAIPVAPLDTAEELEDMADDFICLLMPDDFIAVGAYYEDFRQTTDEEVVDMIVRSDLKGT
ncbi:MAG: putative phosphoribosyl transferase [Syntrophorhabdaceae bacterium PtaU1.Bin034]|jgi:predicted phosphoribosyltransferase|nr:MAG: putative phosphoribosyl transferase [Syntrophorhabdaceae bacterium PtaU1.Bin034]